MICEPAIKDTFRCRSLVVNVEAVQGLNSRKNNGRFDRVQALPSAMLRPADHVGVSNDNFGSPGLDVGPASFTPLSPLRHPVRGDLGCGLEPIVEQEVLQRLIGTFDTPIACLTASAVVTVLDHLSRPPRSTGTECRTETLVPQLMSVEQFTDLPIFRFRRMAADAPIVA